MDIINVAGNKITDHGVECMIYGITSINNQTLYNPSNWQPYQASMKTVQNVKSINLSGNNIGDGGAQVIAEALAGGKLPSTQKIDISGNHVTPKGETALVKALKAKKEDAIILTQKLEQSTKLLPFVGTKEEKIALYKEILKQGAIKGTNNQAIVVDKSFSGSVKDIYNQFTASTYGTVGFIKCNWEPEGVVKSYAQGKITAKMSKVFSKIFGKFTSVQGVVSCYLEASDAAWLSPEGQEHATYQLCVMGETEFCGDQ